MGPMYLCVVECRVFTLGNQFHDLGNIPHEETPPDPVRNPLKESLQIP